MMRTRAGALLLFGLAGGALAASLMSGVAMAQQAASTNYSVDEAFFGTGGQLCDPGVSGYSANYCAGATAGDLATGESTTVSSDGATAGSNTSRQEYIEFIVNSSSTNLGVLMPGTAATTSGTFSVKSYLSHGYNVVSASDPPRSSGGNPHTLTNLTSPTGWNTNAEQFGINLVANTSPATVGANVSHSPDSTFSFGVPAAGYNTTNQFKYVKGDTIASSPKSSGTSTFTISYLYNVTTNTPSGEYNFGHILVATSSY